MALLKSYTCTNCGGVLNFDEDQEIFECPFCGQEFNFTDFHRDELLNQAAKSLKELRYETAKEKYDTLLSNNPKDFEALRGIVLVQGRISSLEAIDSPDNIRYCDLEAAVIAADDAGKIMDGSSEIQYFERLTKLLELGKEFRDKTADALDRSEEAREKYRAAAEGEKKSRERLNYAGNYIGIVLTMIFGVLIFVFLLATGLNITRLVPASLTAFGVIALIVLAGFLIHRHKVRTALNIPKSSEYITSGHVIQDFLSEEAVEIRKRYIEELELLKKEDPASKGYMPPKMKKKSSANDPFINITKTVTCAKCGGQLHPNKEKGLFECKFCGVAYGMSLFFNNTLRKAKEAVKRDDYTEADQRFSHMLLVDPHDFDALLGRIFCVGKWKIIDDIDLSDTFLPAVYKKLKDRIGEAVDHAAAEDRMFFVTMADLADVLEKNACNEQKIRKCQNELNAANMSEIHIAGGKNSRELIERKKEIYAQLEEYSLIKYDLLKRFGPLKGSLLKEKEHHAARVSAS